MKRTWVGLALRAAAQSRDGVQSAGVDVLRLDQIAFGMGVALAAVAGLSVFVLGMIVERVLIRPMFERGMEARAEYATVVTIALAILARGIVQIWSGPFERSPGSTMPTFQRRTTRTRTDSCSF